MKFFSAVELEDWKNSLIQLGYEEEAIDVNDNAQIHFVPLTTIHGSVPAPQGSMDNQ